MNFGCGAKIRSIHGEEVSNFGVGSLITWCNPNWDVKFSITSPSEVVLLKLLSFNNKNTARNRNKRTLLREKEA